ncbi:MAG TPA: hypothetical protein VGB18_01770 [Candidatus Thermoplasmatota archaeon]
MRATVAATLRRIRGPVGRFGFDVLLVVPFAVLLALGLGFTVWVGAELSHAYPSDSAPNGWPGPASFDAGVATLRPQLVLAAAIPGILLGLMSARRFRIGITGPVRSGALILGDLALIAIAAWGAAVIGREGAAKTANEAFWSFTGAHALLAASFYALAMLSSVTFRKAPALVVGVLGTGYVAVYDSFLRWKALRELGIVGLRAGALPAWFYAAQAASPISLYRALLIIWHRGFMNSEERAVLGNATLPPWMTVEILATLLLFLWILIPLELAWIVWTLRYDHDRKMLPVRNTAFATSPTGLRRLASTWRSHPIAHAARDRARTAWSTMSSLVTSRPRAQKQTVETTTTAPLAPDETKQP